MKFVDSTNLIVRAGDGGNGVASFRREKYIPLGGPDGGNGGSGGNIYFIGNSHLNTLLDYKYRSVYKAPSGNPGRGKNCFGAKGEDVVLPMPLGTIVHNSETEEVIGELVSADEKLLVAKGGKGGLGNSVFKSSQNRSPRQFTSGGKGENRKLFLELRVLTDAALVGMPNAGKSSMLRALSAARPKVADYPFTTLSPQPGIVNYGLAASEMPFVLTDIPGIIEGAAQGHGLGITFLRHIKRARLLLHLVDLSAEDPVRNIEIFEKELQDFSSELAEMPSLLVGNKQDLLTDAELAEKKKLLRKKSKDFFIVSALSKEGLEPLCRAVRDFLTRDDEEREAEASKAAKKIASKA